MWEKATTLSEISLPSECVGIYKAPQARKVNDSGLTWNKSMMTPEAGPLSQINVTET